MESPTYERSGPIPCFLNPKSGTAEQVSRAVEADARFELRECDPDELQGALHAEVERSTPRVAVAGGDGTLAAAANALVRSDTELAILPAGTLNHFATHLGIPGDLDKALDIAAESATRAVDLGKVNDRVFLNTSSVGAYVTFVKLRDRMERWLGYHLATLVAAVRILVHLPIYTVQIEIEGKQRHFQTPLAFIGHGERELQFPTLGERVPGGQAGLHVFVVASKTRARFLALTLVAAALGVRSASRTPNMESFFVENCIISLPVERTLAAIDGELLPIETPLHYRPLREALQVAVPSEKESEP